MAHPSAALPPPWAWAEGTRPLTPAGPGSVKVHYQQLIFTTTAYKHGKQKEKQIKEAEDDS